MARSMTGFGACEKRIGQGMCRVEARSVNSRFFDFSAKLPAELQFLESELKATVHELVPRGKVYLFVSFGGQVEEEAPAKLDEAKARRYVTALEKVAKKLRLKPGFEVRDLLLLPGIFTYQANGRNVQHLWEEMKPVVHKAIAELIRAKELEGRTLVKDIVTRAARIGSHLDRIRAQASTLSREVFEKLKERAAQLSRDLAMDHERLTREVAILAQHADVTEELVRASSHLVLLGKVLRERDAIGKKLDFTLQEIFREVNTLSAKASSFGISQEVIQIKSELERIREQIQNLE